MSKYAAAAAANGHAEKREILLLSRQQQTRSTRYAAVHGERGRGHGGVKLSPLLKILLGRIEPLSHYLLSIDSVRSSASSFSISRRARIVNILFIRFGGSRVGIIRLLKRRQSIFLTNYGLL